MANEKMTKRDYFEQIKANYALTEDEIAFVDHEIDLLAKKASADRKPSAKQKENDELKAEILDEMVADTLYTIGDMLKGFTCFGDDITSQRVSALVKQLVDSGKVVRIMDKRKAYFRLT